MLHLAQTVRGMASWKRQSEEEVTALDYLFTCLTVAKPLEDALKNAIIDEENIADTASPELADIRRKIRSTQQRVRSQLDNMIDPHRIPIKSPARWQIPTGRGFFCLDASAGQRAGRSRIDRRQGRRVRKTRRVMSRRAPDRSIYIFYPNTKERLWWYSCRSGKKCRDRSRGFEQTYHTGLRKTDKSVREAGMVSVQTAPIF